MLFLKDYASYIKDSMVSELTELNRNLMLSIDVIPIPTDEAVREVENRLLGVETNITNWQRKQNQNNNFSAVVPYDMELQRKESKPIVNTMKKSVFRRTKNVSENTRKNCEDLRRHPPRSRTRQEIPQRRTSRRKELTPVLSVIRRSKPRNVPNTPLSSLPVLRVNRL